MFLAGNGNETQGYRLDKQEQRVIRLEARSSWALILSV